MNNFYQMLFTRKGNSEPDNAKDHKESVKIKYPNPNIFLIDFDKEVADALVEEGYNITIGSFGTQVKVSNINKLDAKFCLPNHSIPPNLHEYEIVVVDLAEKNTYIEYNPKEHEKDIITGMTSTYIASSYPETIFNPRPFGSLCVREEIEEICEKGGLVIIFASKNFSIKYHFIKKTSSGLESGGSYDHWIYSFIPQNFNWENKFGENIRIDNPSMKFQLFLRKYFENPAFKPNYNIIFKFRADQEIIPLLRNASNEIIGFSQIHKKGTFIVLPQIENKKVILIDLFLNELPGFFPELFPYQTKFQWLEDQHYFLPNESEFQESKSSIITEYKEKIDEIEQKILDNRIKYQCLHGIITKNGQGLVNDVGRFLEWLGFENVRLMDYEKDQAHLEEDIQIEIPQGLLVIEVKGIQGTSKDEDCNQINKIKFRRAEERNSFDVFGLYIVNHQKHLPPLERENPPFKLTQIEDAIREKRGLLSTWQLFNLYYSIQSGAILKEEARNSLLNCGLITFLPSNVMELGKPKNILKDSQVFLIDSLFPISKSNKIIIKRNERFLLANIIEMQVHDKFVETIEKGEVGIKIDLSLKKSDVLFLKE